MSDWALFTSTSFLSIHIHYLGQSSGACLHRHYDAFQYLSPPTGQGSIRRFENFWIFLFFTENQISEQWNLLLGDIPAIWFESSDQIIVFESISVDIFDSVWRYEPNWSPFFPIFIPFQLMKPDMKEILSIIPRIFFLQHRFLPLAETQLSHTWLVSRRSTVLSNLAV